MSLKYFGSVNNNASYTGFPYLSYVWNECYIKINGNYVWGVLKLEVHFKVGDNKCLNEVKG